jgi:type I restriction enzyme R subunit
VINEADTCRRYVLPKLYEAGWKDDQISEQKYFTDGRIIPVGRKHRRRPGKKTDYLLSYRPDFPLAVVEAKAQHKLPSDGLQQAMDYAALLDLRFAYSTNGHGIVEHDYTTGRQRELTSFPPPSELWDRLRGVGVPADEKAALDLIFPFNRELRNPDGSVKTPRYFQAIAINRAVRAVLEGKKRILLTMATGTGKTFTAVQIVWKLWKTGRKRRILYLADRNILVDQPMAGDFSIFGDAVWKIHGEAKKGREIYFALYQAISEDESRPGLYREYPRDYFDLIIVDECHRGSARDESRWREILEYFAPATQIGMTATPRRTDNVNTYDYFGDPVYTYSLATGIDDGFLAPYRVYRVVSSLDATGWRPEKGQLDRNGLLIPDGEYGTKDFEKTVSFPTRTAAVARHLTSYLKKTNRFDKTIVFCVDQEHAAQMRGALHRENEDLTRDHPHYVARVVADEGKEGRKHLDEFRDPEKLTPVILTTSQLLTTGVDLPDCRNIGLFKPIESIVEFKQIIGRGTRLYPDKDKLFFTILDYVGATRLFADPEFDGEPEVALEEMINEDGALLEEKRLFPEGPPPADETADSDEQESRRRKFLVDGVPVEISAEAVWQLDSEGKRMRLASYTEFSAEQVRKLFSSAAELRSRWSVEEQRNEVISSLEDRGIALEDLAEAIGQPEADPLDLLVHIAWNAPLRTRRERAEQVLRGRQAFFERYSPSAREVLKELLRKYAEHGPSQLEDLRILEVPPLSERGSPVEIARLFGGPEGFRQAVEELEQVIYAA